MNSTAIKRPSIEISMYVCDDLENILKMPYKMETIVFIQFGIRKTAI